MVSADKLPPVEAVKEPHTDKDGDSEVAPPSRDNPTVAQGKGTVVAFVGWVPASSRCCLVSVGEADVCLSVCCPSVWLTAALLSQRCRSSPRQRGCAPATPAAADTCGTAPARAAASAASTATSSSKRGKGRGLWALSIPLPCPTCSSEAWERLWQVLGVLHDPLVLEPGWGRKTSQGSQIFSWPMCGLVNIYLLEQEVAAVASRLSSSGRSQVTGAFPALLLTSV